MTSSFESGVLLGHAYRLDDGSLIRLRLARPSDVTAVRGLLAMAGSRTPDLEAARLVHFDPRQRYVVCATGLVESSERLLGIGAIGFGGARSGAPELLIVSDGAPEELGRLLRSVLVEAAKTSARAA